jgi:sulfur carrier protein
MAAEIAVTVVWAQAPRSVLECALRVPAGSTLAQVLMQLPWALPPLSAERSAPWSVSVWGRAAAPDTVLEEGDRVEITRALRVDPKVARRERFARQGARKAGLFARPPTAGRS